METRMQIPVMLSIPDHLTIFVVVAFLGSFFCITMLTCYCVWRQKQLTTRMLMTSVGGCILGSASVTIYQVILVLLAISRGDMITL